MNGEASLLTTRLMGLILVPALLGWMAVFRQAKQVKSLLATGSNWLKWRPLPHGLLAAVFLAIGLGLLAQLAVLSMLSVLGETALPAVFMHLVSILTFHVPGTVMALAWCQRARIPVAQALGLEPGRGWAELGPGTAGYILAFPAVVLAGALTLFAFNLFGWEMTLQPTVTDLKSLQYPVEWIIVFLLVVVIGPFCEEVLFRSVLFPWIAHRAGTAAGLIFHSLIFALIHAHAGSALPLFVLSIFLGLLHLLRRNLMAAFWMHAVFNGMSLLNMFLLSRGEPL